mmetsp:Transcript_50009/g.89768  ORF Transcript_50009/g.89768 Transcript_50009/m.89768 type:complete len:107 (+) Transcript_50009:152-472(+)
MLPSARMEVRARVAARRMPKPMPKHTSPFVPNASLPEAIPVEPTEAPAPREVGSWGRRPKVAKAWLSKKALQANTAAKTNAVSTEKELCMVAILELWTSASDCDSA